MSEVKKKTKKNNVNQALKDFELIHKKHAKKKEELIKLKGDLNSKFEKEISNFYSKKYTEIQFSNKLQKEFDDVAKKMGNSGNTILTIANEKWAVYVTKNLDKPNEKWRLYDGTAEQYCGSKEGFEQCHKELKGNVRVLTDFGKCKDRKCREKFYQK